MKIIARIIVIIILPFFVVLRFIQNIVGGIADGFGMAIIDIKQDISEARHVWRKGLPTHPKKE